MRQLPLFVFGTLRRSECNHGCLAGAYDHVQPAWLTNFVRIAPLMIAREAGSFVDGELFFLTAETHKATLFDCDRLEELPSNGLIGSEYRRIAVRVQTDSDEFIAWAYAHPDSECDSDLQTLTNDESMRLKNP